MLHNTWSWDTSTHNAVSHIGLHLCAMDTCWLGCPHLRYHTDPTPTVRFDDLRLSRKRIVRFVETHVLTLGRSPAAAGPRPRARPG